MAHIVKLIIANIGHFFRYCHILYLKSAGVKIGSNCMISLHAKIDTRRGEVSIGNRCTITYGCIIASHDRSAMHIDASDDGEGRVSIGDNVYLGVNTIVLRNVSIGKNTVIGAGSVVVKDIPPNVVAVGNPAKVIKRMPARE